MNMDEPKADSYTATLPDGAGYGAAQLPFFSTPELTQRLDLLRHLTDNSERVIILKGPAGSGKTTLLRQFKAHARPEWNLCGIEADPMLQPDQLFTQLFRAYGLEDTNSGDIEKLVDRFSLLQSDDSIAVVIVDDAHLLPVATIIALLRLHERRAGSRALVRILLFATEQISDQLYTPQIQSMNLQSIQELEMPLFTSEQCSRFVDFIVGGITGQAAQNTTSGALERICSEGGCPGEIEAKLLELVQAGGSKKSASSGFSAKGILNDLPKSVLVGVPVLGVVLILTLIFQDEINRIFGAPVEGSLVELSPDPTSAPIIPLKLPEVPEKVLVDDAPPLPIYEVPRHAPEPAGQPAVVLAEPERVPLIPDEQESESVEALQTEKERQAKPLKHKKAGVLVNLPEIAEKEILSEALGVSDKPSDDSADKVQTEPPELESPSVDVGGAEVVKPAAKQPLVETSRPEATVRDVLPPVQVKEAGVKGRTWLSRQKSNRYTLQLIGVQEEYAAKQFIRQHGIRDEAAYFKTQRDGKPWFSVVYGVYSGREAAVKAKKKLPSSLKNTASWPRSFGSIQQAIGN